MANGGKWIASGDLEWVFRPRVRAGIPAFQSLCMEIRCVFTAGIRLQSGLADAAVIRMIVSQNIAGESHRLPPRARRPSIWHADSIGC
ncbi:hypothetical protein [Cupriavidus yeoncheonensis]|uniref:hypothetical protein n=1 Tax=Cupriavidus yeoncheonensis TaxID=1462994 RepID=UPI001BA6774C|nr:hypothetical protein [Cupriavidus yeoncheonensis]